MRLAVSVPVGSGPGEYQKLTTWGDSWLAAKALGLRNIADDDPQRNGTNVAKGLLMVWDELRGQSVKQLGGEFHVMSQTSPT